MILNEFFNLPQVFEKDMEEGNSRDLTNTPRDKFISRMTPSMDANALRQKVAKIVNSPGFTEDTILQIVDAGDNISHPAGRYIQQAFHGLQYNLGKEYEDYPERVAEKLLHYFRSMLPAYRLAEADEWEEDTEKRERFLQYAKQKLMASNGNIEMAAALSQQDNKIFGSPFLNDPASQQAPVGAVSVIDNRPYTRAIAQIMAYIESRQGQAEISATQAALWLTPQGKKFLERVSTDLYGIDNNAARKKHAIALSGYQVQHLGGKITGSYYGPDDFHSAEQNMTKEVAAIYDLVTLELEREAGIESAAEERQKDMAFWNAIPYPLRVIWCASLGKTPGQMESILFGTEADMLASLKPKPNATPTPAVDKEEMAESTGQDRKSWMASIQQQYPDVKFVQAKMLGAPIMAMVNGKPVAQFDTKKGVAEGIFGSRPSPVLPVVDKIAKIAGGLTPQNVEVGKQIIQNKASEITRMLSPQVKTGVDVIEQGVAEGYTDDDIETTRQFRNAIAGLKARSAIDKAKDGAGAKYYSDGATVTPQETARRAAERKAKKDKKGMAEGVRTESAELAKQYGWAYNQGEYGASMTHPKHGRISLSSPVTSRSGDTAVEREWTHNNASGIGDRSLAQHLQSLKEQGVSEAKDDYVPPKEADYGPEYQAMVRRVGQKARAQEKAKQQQPKTPVRESRRELLRQIIQS